MSNIIHLLPDAVANQIAAGEVVQRPSSALKEMLENSIDAASTSIQVILKDAGKGLLRVVDDGRGMSASDARMCFERHATSKISDAKDLFALTSFGFRGEALASIAAIAQVEMNTRQRDEDIGTKILIEGSKVITTEPTSCPQGTSIAVKNLFFNVPARRNFLKSNNVELRHCIEDFQRIAIAHPGIAMELYHNDKPIFQLKKGNLKQRIVSIFGANFDEKIVPIEAQTNSVTISGFIGKPQFARKTKGEQYFFVNNRFIKHHYLNHAVQSAFEELIPEGAFPSYFIFFEVNPSDIDVNIHPTKTEINFLDARLIYSFLRSAVKQAFGKFSIAPTLDFNMEQSLNIPPPRPNTPIPAPSIKVDPSYSPFKSDDAWSGEKKADTAHWEKLFTQDSPSEGSTQTVPSPETSAPETAFFPPEEESSFINPFLQLQQHYILTTVTSGLMIIDQRKAHQRVLFEIFQERLKGSEPGIQKSLFPETWHLNAQDASLVRELEKDFQQLGFELTPAGGNSFIINGIPADAPQDNILQMLENTLEQYKNESPGTSARHSRLAKAMAKSMSISDKKALTQEEMQSLTNALFACAAPENDLDRGKTLVILPVKKVTELF
ncbi:MAG: DNA mismatch repair protein MutL [Bacteroidetes bacterium]|nr:MAG: DNA mismatch repair protein MutL [Bacteroidota bacterium]PIE87683.1 MAG: DNA mismatch repair protein MutL [Bacteroidota bacterium]